MPEGNRFSVTLGLFTEVSDNGSVVMDDFGLDEIVANLYEGEYPDFLEYSDDTIYELAALLANESIERIVSHLLHYRTLLRQLRSEREAREMFVNEEPNWEV